MSEIFRGTGREGHPILALEMKDELQESQECAYCAKGLDSNIESYFCWMFLPASTGDTLPCKRRRCKNKKDSIGVDWVNLSMCRECMTRVQSDLGDEGLIYLRRKGKVYLHENHQWVKED